MPLHLYHTIAFIVSVGTVLLATPIVKTVGLKNGYVDKPNERKVHREPIVRLGGVAIFTAMITAVLLVWALGAFTDLSITEKNKVFGLILGSLGFFLIGFADDLFTLGALPRLLMQIGVATLVWFMGVKIEFLSIPFHIDELLPVSLNINDLVHIGWLSLPISVIWLVGMANAINWIDGLDGLAAGVSGIAASVMLVVALFLDRPAAALIAAALAGGTLGFLRYNFNPAQIFMGDGGAYFIGFTLAGIGVIGLVKSTALTAVFLPYLILAVPILDMSAVIISRISKGKSPFLADKTHLHHRLLEAGIPQRLTVLFIYSLTLWVGTLAFVFSGIPSGEAYAMGATMLLAYFGWKVWRRTKM